MLDIKYIKDHAEDVKAMLSKRGVDVEVDKLIELDNQRLALVTKVENLRAERNQLSKKHSPDNIQRSKEIKGELKDLEAQLKSLTEDVKEIHLAVPNMLHPDVPKGQDDDDNLEIRRWGGNPELDFTPLDHEELGEKLQLFNTKKAAEISGSGFYFLTGDAVMLEFALIKYAMDIVTSAGFLPMITPELIRKEVASGTGYLPKREAPDIYKIEDEELFLIATAEMPLAAYHSKEVLPEEQLPKKYAGFSSCFRKEAGAHGKHKKGIFRVHQFDKVEMFAFAKPEESMALFDQFIALSEKLYQGLKIPYRVVNICSGDMNGPGYIKYDLEYFSPVDKAYREMTSATNTTDYQARRLNIRYKKSDGSLDYVHTLNNTTIAIGRTLIAIMENYQQADGTIKVPEVLQSYVGKEVIA
ncbi:MAG: serine--tRNA ligase [Chlamydiota bacterium]